MRATRRQLTIVVGVLAVLALAGGVAVRLGCGETDEPLPELTDAAPGGPARTAVGARPLLGDGGLPSGLSRISGTVRDLGRAPVAEVEVRFTGEAGEAGVTTDAAGRYQLELAAGRYRTRALAASAISLTAGSLAVVAGVAVDGVDFEVVRTAVVRGRVVDGGGEPVTGATIGHHTEVAGEQLDDEQTAPLGSATSARGGEFQVTVPAGRVNLRAEQGGRAGSTLLLWVEPGAEVNGVEIVIEAAVGADAGPGPGDAAAAPDGGVVATGTGALTGTVRGPDGPLAVFAIELMGATRDVHPAGMPDRLRFVSADGSYRIDRLPAGPCTVTASADGLAPAEQPARVVAGGIAVVSFTLGAGAAVEGTITSSKSGAPVSGVLVAMATGQAGAFAYTDRAGSYRLRDIAPGRRSLDARHPGFVGKIIPAIELRAGQTVRQDLTLEPLAADAAAEIELAGIGASLQMAEDRCTVVGLVPGGPAELADLRPGDAILEIDGRAVAGWSFAEAIEAIRGVAGTVVRLKLIRGDETFIRDVLRATIRYREP